MYSAVQQSLLYIQQFYTFVQYDDINTPIL